MSKAKLLACTHCPPGHVAECRASVLAGQPVMCEKSFTVPVLERDAALAAGYRYARARPLRGPVELAYTANHGGDEMKRAMCLVERPAGSGPIVPALRFIQL